METCCFFLSSYAIYCKDPVLLFFTLCSQAMIFFVCFQLSRLLIRFGQFSVIQGSAVWIPCSKVRAAFLRLHDAVPRSSIFPPMFTYDQGNLRIITWFCSCRSSARTDKTFIRFQISDSLCPLIIFFNISMQGLTNVGLP